MISIGNVFKTNPVQFDEVWVICYKVEELEVLFASFDNVHHVPELAPTEGLFKQYRNLFHSGLWNKQSFNEIYVPRFLSEIQAREESMSLLRKLVMLSNKKNIRLVCFCPEDEEQMCHRSIVAGILYNMGACIECDETYRVYRLNKPFFSI